MSDQLQQYVPVAILILVALGFAVTNLILPSVIGKKRIHTPTKDSAYECGLPAMQEGQPRFSVKFYMIAMLFIVFDIEVVFMLGWGAVFRDLFKEMGWTIIGGAAVFLLILEVGHIYLWKKGALDWAPRKKS
ncbi:MAG: NADH-quinone oxidoreductase subunit A [Verrucomicrobiae bacterium]|nr:NADH-quinone oxidoreductase subunit A [Verrucomicrobiae bacterium]